jgi:hypothetical protein
MTTNAPTSYSSFSTTPEVTAGNHSNTREGAIMCHRLRGNENMTSIIRNGKSKDGTRSATDPCSLIQSLTVNFPRRNLI